MACLQICWGATNVCVLMATQVSADQPCQHGIHVDLLGTATNACVLMATQVSADQPCQHGMSADLLESNKCLCFDGYTGECRPTLSTWHVCRSAGEQQMFVF